MSEEVDSVARSIIMDWNDDTIMSSPDVTLELFKQT
jgi:hypothetical protein